MGKLTSRIIPVEQSRPGSGAAPPFERIAIVGFGLIGGSIALAIRERWQGGLLIAVDRKEVLESAMRRHAADVGGDDLGMAGDADLIVLAAPVLQNIAALERLAGYVPGDAVVTDVGSTKTATLRAAEKLPPRLRFIGGHPLAGAAVGGLDAARPDLFAGRPWVLTPPPSAAAADIDKLEGFVAALGATPVRMEAADHDRLVGYLSHLPQLAASALMHVVGEQVGAEGLALAGRGLRDTTRLASSPARIWRDVVQTNGEHVRAGLDALIEALEQLKASAAGDPEALDRIFGSAERWKRTLERE
jgi:prephenate dehydrogenase